MKTVHIGQLSEYPPGTCRTVDIDGYFVAVCNVDGTVYALDNTCPHAGGPLGEGKLNGEVVECPWHGWRFNVRSGERVENPNIAVERYPVTVVDGVIRVELPSSYT